MHIYFSSGTLGLVFLAALGAFFRQMVLLNCFPERGHRSVVDREQEEDERVLRKHHLDLELGS